jgi:hypothetical protein
MGEVPEGELPGSLKLLKGLVTVLTAVMIVGFIVLIAVFVTRFPRGATVSLPEQITLPDRTRATAYTQGPDWYAVVTDDQQILIFNRDGSLRQQIAILPAQ